MIKIAAKIFFFLTVVGSFGAIVARAERLPLKIYTSADGLGSSATFTMVRDAHGFIWLCSRDGLVRFDGYRFITYRIGKEGDDPAVFNLIPTRRGDYWINLNRGADYRFRAQSDATLLEPLPKVAAPNDPRVALNVEAVDTAKTPFPIFEDAAGNLWGANSETGIFLIKETDGQTVSEPVELNLPGNPLGKFTAINFKNGRNGALWVGTHWGAARRLPDGRMIHYQIMPENNTDETWISGEDSENRLWIARPDGIVVAKVETIAELSASNDSSPRRMTVKKVSLDAGGQTELPGRAGEAVFIPFSELLINDKEISAGADYLKPAVFAIVCTTDGKVWMGGNHGLLHFDGKRFRQFTTEHGLGANTLNSLVEDNEGYIWASSYAGLHRINPRGLTSFDETDGLERDKIHSIYEDQNGALIIVSGNYHISRLQNNRFQMTRPLLPAGALLTWLSGAALLDSRGDWWVNTPKGVFRYAGVERLEDLSNQVPSAVYTKENGLVGTNNVRVFEDSKGDIWMSTWVTEKTTGLTRFVRATGELQQFTTKDGLPTEATAIAFAEDRAGGLWFGFNAGGIARYRDGRFTPLEEPGLPQGGITHLHRDLQGRIWVSSNTEGLFRVDNPADEHPVFKRYSIADGLTSNNVRAVMDDLEGNIYIGTVRGVNRLSPDTGRIKYYGTSDGLASDFINTIFRDRQGTIWFGTFNGLSKLVPESEISAPPPPVMISGLRIASEDYAVSPLGQREVSVAEQSAERNNLQIDFLSITTGVGAVRYQYKLDGAPGADWSVPSAERSVTFVNLAPGAYQFLVRAVNPENVSSENPARVSFSIARPFWQRWSFRLAAALLITLIVYGLYRYRIAQIIKLERVRTRLATDLHDDIGSSLSKIAILSEVVRQKNGGSAKANGGGFEPLEIIANTSREMVDSMSDIVWAINPERDHLSDLIQRMRHFAEEMLDAQEIEYEFSDAENLKDITLGADLRREIYLIFKECVNNLAKHSEATRAEFDVRLENECLIIEIEDNGRGFVAESLRAETSSAYSADIGDAANGGARSFGGNGLQNMRRRARNLGGDFLIDSAPGAGTRLRLEVPVGKKLFLPAKRSKN